MFEEIKELIKSEQYGEAEKLLLPLVVKTDAEINAKAHYFLGLVYTYYDPDDFEPSFIKGNEHKAWDHLRRNLSSDYPHPYGYYLLSRNSQDENITLNYLHQGIQKFPNNVLIWRELFFRSPKKAEIITQIENNQIIDDKLYISILNYYTQEHQWDNIGKYVKAILERNKVNEFDQLICSLLRGYSLLFRSVPDYIQAIDVLNATILIDTNNALAYAHYLGIIYAYIKLGEPQNAITFFDRIPVNNSIYDYVYGSKRSAFCFTFTTIYSDLFEVLSEFFAKDRERKLKAAALYALYLYYPSEDYGTYRYKKADALAVQRFLKSEYSPQAAAALVFMRSHFQQYTEAFDAFWLFFTHYDDPMAYFLEFSEWLYCVPDQSLHSLAETIAEHLKEDAYSLSMFKDLIFEPFVDSLYKKEKYNAITLIVNELTNKFILDSQSAFECAYALKACNNKRSKDIYETLYSDDPNNSSVTNNLGVIYEEAGNLTKARQFFKLACELDPDDKIHTNNLMRVQEKLNKEKEQYLYDVQDYFSLEALLELGYTDDLCDQFDALADSELKEILKRDLWECVIAIIAHQDKSATVLCGSIIEAILLSVIKNRQIKVYDISETRKSKKNPSFPVDEMGLNDLLYVAQKEKILHNNSYHLGHFIKDYRNVVHPAKEIRMSETISHESVLTMWSVLKKITNDLYLFSIEERKKGSGGAGTSK